MDDSELTLEQAAEVLGIHHMTAQRFVRTGILDATRRGDTWWVTPEAVENARQGRRSGRRAAQHGGPPRLDSLVDELQRLMVSGDDVASWRLIERALDGGAEPLEIYLDLLGPALSNIGDAWARDQVTIAEEHRATQVAFRLIGLLGARLHPRTPCPGSIVIGAVEGDHHALTTALVADLWRSQSVDVIDLGGHTPAASFVEAARSTDRLIAVAISVSHRGHDHTIRTTIESVRQAELAAPVLLGGAGIDDEEHARRLGADHFGQTGRDALALLHGPLAGPGTTLDLRSESTDQQRAPLADDPSTSTHRNR